MKFKRILVSRHGGPEVMEVVEEELHSPAARDVRIKVLGCLPCLRLAARGVRLQATAR